MAVDLYLRIGGEAGQGMQTLGTLLARLFHRSGLYVFTSQDYMSRIRGGHNFYDIRVSDRPVQAARPGVDLLVALDRRTVQEHAGAMSERGVILAGKDSVPGVEALTIPLGALAEEAGSPLYENMVAVGAVLCLIQHPQEGLRALVEEAFGRKGAEVVEANLQAARSGCQYLTENHPQAPKFDLPAGRPNDHLLIGGIEAMALGALAAGLQFYSAYPMTPSTGLLNYFAGHAADLGLVVEQAEDEIAAINLALGASFCGARSMVGTSGGGFALMVEGLSLAGITETPVVVALGQRPGPATGLPTRTEQGELWFALHSGHGEFPRAVLTPGTPEEAFYLTCRAFNLADHCQTPVIVLYDQYLADMMMTQPRFDFSGLSIERHLATAEEAGSGYSYLRYRLTESGLSPRALPGTPEVTVCADSDEHDEDGHIIEDAATRIAMVEKRLRKAAVLDEQVLPPEIEGDPEPEVLLLGWGSTRGCVAEATDLLRERGVSAARLHCPQVWPFPAEPVAAAMQSAGQSFVVENSATGQLRGLIRRETGLLADHLLSRYDGRPFVPAEIADQVLAARSE